MAPRYTALQSAPDAVENDRELEAAFESDDEEDRSTSESTPLARRAAQPAAVNTSNTYDFEREREHDYAEFPPPGSPTRAMPNNTLGNSNGIVRENTTPVEYQIPRPSFFRRALGAVGAVLPTHYARLPTSDNRPRGGGIENDGVFANVAAKPTVRRTVVTERGEIEIVPEDTQTEAPPSYAAAQADSVPPYWETTVHAPAQGDSSPDGMIIDDLPTGSLLIFAANLSVSFFFQYLGFMVTYLLHTTHAAKFGSRAGLGLTLIQFGLFSRSARADEGQSVYDPTTDTWSTVETTPDIFDPFSDTGGSMSGNTTSNSAYDTFVTGTEYGKEWLSFLLMTIGWFLILTSILGYWRVKRWESSIKYAAANPPTAAELERDLALRRNIAEVFGVEMADDSPRAAGEVRTDARGHTVVIPDRQALEEERLTRDLRAAGLI